MFINTKRPWKVKNNLVVVNRGMSWNKNYYFVETKINTN